MSTLNKLQDDSLEAERFMKDGYAVHSIIHYTGWGAGILYATKFTKQEGADQILYLPQTFFREKIESSHILQAFREQKGGRKRLIVPTGSRGDFRKQIKHRSTHLTKLSKDNQDELAEEYKKKGFTMIKIGGRKGDKSWCLYETSLALPDKPDSEIKLWISYQAFKSEAEKQMFLVYRMKKRKERLKKWNEQARSRNRIEENSASTGTPRNGNRFKQKSVSRCHLVIAQNEEHTIRENRASSEAKEVRENCLKAATSNKVVKQARDFGVQVRPEDFGPVDKVGAEEPTRKKERRRKQVRENATQTSHAYFTWDTVH